MPDNATIGTAYVQVVPSAKGIKGSLTNLLGGESDAAGKESGKSLGSSLVSTLKGVVVAAGVGKIVSSAFSEGAALQQSIGGVETLYKDSADIIKNYAAEAYKTAGLSANEYMTQSTSFAAALVGSLGGDTKKAAEAANTALVDMSDNANKMGTDMESIQNAYQGFAKGNYTMLDNLKLGYGGTKGEMERLLADAQKFSGVKYDIDNLADVYDAIHVVQTELDITGTTAKEQSTTFEGSFTAMQAAAQNFLGYLTTGGDVTGALSALLDSVGTFLFGNVVPMIGSLLSAIPPLIGTFFTELLPNILQKGTELIENLSNGLGKGGPKLNKNASKVVIKAINSIAKNAGKFLSAGLKLIGKLGEGFMKNYPKVITTVGKILVFVVRKITSSAPQLMEKGFQLISKLASGIAKNMPAVGSAILKVVVKILATIASNLPKILQKGIEILGKIIAGIIRAIPKIPGTIIKIVNKIKSEFSRFDWKSIGKNIIDGIANGIKNFAGNIASAAKEAAKSAFDGAKKFLGIKSPSRLFRDQIGKNIALGMAAGIEGNTSEVDKAMNALSAASVGQIDTKLTVSAQESKSSEMVRKMDEMIKAVKNGQVIKLDSREVGRMVRAYG